MWTKNDTKNASGPKVYRDPPKHLRNIPTKYISQNKDDWLLYIVMFCEDKKQQWWWQGNESELIHGHGRWHLDEELYIPKIFKV